MTVIQFPANNNKDASGEEQGGLSGMAKCSKCKFEWLATSKLGEFDFLECPSCGLFRGTFMGNALKTGEEHLLCACGCDLYRITKDSVYCMNCGVDVNFDEV